MKTSVFFAVSISLLLGLASMHSCQKGGSSAQAPSNSAETASDAQSPSVAPQHTAAAASARPLRASALPHYLLGYNDMQHGSGYSYLEFPGEAGLPSELHVFSQTGSAKQKIVFAYEGHKLVRQVELMFFTAEDRREEKDFVWEAQSGTYTGDAGTETIVLDSAGNVIERSFTPKGEKLPSLFVHNTFDAQGRALSSARLDAEPKATEYKHTLSKYTYPEQSPKAWLNRSALISRGTTARNANTGWAKLRADAITFPNGFDKASEFVQETRTAE